VAELLRATQQLTLPVGAGDASGLTWQDCRMTSLQLKPGTAFADVYERARAIAPEAFDADGIKNLIGGEWVRVGDVREHRSPVDGSVIPGPPLVDKATADRAVEFAIEEHAAWAQTTLAERKEKVVAALDLMTEHRDVLSLLIVWEIGKPWRLATTDVDRAIEGVRWSVEEIDRQFEGRAPLDGPVSNIASWNYPMSVQVHAELVQLLVGNAVVAKTPTQGGFHVLTLAHALMRRVGLPVSLMSGAGGTVGDVLVGAEGIGAVSFVGGRANGREVAIKLEGSDRRHMLEEEGLNTYGVWDFSDWDSLAAQIKKGYEYAKQRCTAYPRFVVQRSQFADFLKMYQPVLDSITFGHPLAVENPDDELPELDFGPLISVRKATEVTGRFDEAIQRGGVPLARRSVSEGRFLDGQDTSAYVAPATVLEPPSSWSLRHSEPFGPLDSIVLVDTESQLIAEMNASNGALVASIATDDEGLAAKVAEQLQAFKVGVNKVRSRGDRDEVFGGLGASWRGAFVGGDLLVEALTVRADGAEERLYGNFPDHVRIPAT